MHKASVGHTDRLVWSVAPAALCLFACLLFACLLAAPTQAAAATPEAEGQGQGGKKTVEVSADGFSARFADGGADSADSTPAADGTDGTTTPANGATTTPATLAITDFSRSNKGTNKTYGGAYFGYRFPLAGQDAFAVVVIDSQHVLVYLPPTAAEQLKMPASELASSQFQQDFIALIEALDAKAANGGTTLASLNLTPASYQFVTTPSVERGGYRYDLAREVEAGYYYACVTLQGSDDGSSGALFALSGRLASGSQVTITQEPTGLAALAAFFTSLDARPFWVSLRTSAVAMLFVFVLGLAAAVWSLKINSRLKGVLDSLFTIPMVLPPTVCGFLLLVAFGNSTAFGRFLMSHGIELVFSWPAAVLAATIVSFPLMYRTARGAFEALDPALGDAARTLGWSERRIFLRLTMPLAWPSIAAGTVLAFARAMGEFGATLFVAGNYPGVTQTMPIAIYFQWMGGHPQVAAFWVVIVILISFVVILFINWYAARTQRYRRASADEMEMGEKERELGEQRREKELGENQREKEQSA